MMEVSLVQYKWNDGDTFNDFYIDPCIAQIKSLAIRLVLKTILGIFGLTAYLFVIYNVNVAWNGLWSLIVVDGLLTLPIYLIMWGRSRQIKNGNFFLAYRNGRKKIQRTQRQSSCVRR